MGPFLVERRQFNFVLFDKKEMHVYYFFESNHLIKVELIFQKIKTVISSELCSVVVVACSRRLVGRNMQNCGVRETSPLLFYFVFFPNPSYSFVPSRLVSSLPFQLRAWNKLLFVVVVFNSTPITYQYLFENRVNHTPANHRASPSARK